MWAIDYGVNTVIVGLANLFDKRRTPKGFTPHQVVRVLPDAAVALSAA